MRNCSFSSFLAPISLAALLGAQLQLHALPANSFSLVEEGWLTAPKNQGVLGTCWAFSNTTAYQSALLRGGLVSGLNDPNLDISTWHLASANGHVAVYTPTYDPRSKTWEYAGWGGFNEYAIGYWTRGLGYWRLQPGASDLAAGGGAVLTSTDPRNVYPLKEASQHMNLLPYAPPRQQMLAPFGLQQSITYAWDNDLSSLDSFYASLKDGLRDYGAISVMMHVNDDFQALKNDQPGYILHDNTLTFNHAVTLAGWDDDKVFEIDGETYTGGWLVQNSWGTKWGYVEPTTGEGGFFWIPYADVTPANLKRGTAVVLRSNEYHDGQRLYSPVVIQNQIFSPYYNDLDVYVAGFEAGTNTYAAQRLSAPRGPSRTTLAALGIWQPDPGMEVDISIYSDWNSTGPAGNLLAQIDDYVMNPDGIGGYQEITLATPLEFNMGESFYVVLDFGDGYSFPVAVDVRSAMEMYGQPNFTGTSWISSDGTNWIDLYSDMETAGIMFLKGISIHYELPLTGAISGLMQTSVVSSVPMLDFANGSELYVNTSLTVSGGLFTVDGNAELRGGWVDVPGDLLVTGSGQLVASAAVNVQGSATVASGPLSVGNFFGVAGKTTVFSDLNILGPRSDWDTVGWFSPASLAVAPGAAVEIEKGGVLKMNGRASRQRLSSGSVQGGEVVNRGWLGGTGVIAANVTNHAYIAPGHSPGTLVIHGNYTHLSSATYLWEANKNDYDQIIVRGNAVLRGNLVLTGTDGYQLQFGDKYKEIISADNLSGAFRKVYTPDGLRARLLEKNDAISVVIAPESYTQLAVTPNEHSVAKALDQFIPATGGDRETVSIALDHLRAHEYGDAFRAIMPSFYQGVAATNINLAVTQVSHLSQRLDGLRMGSGLSFSAEGMAVAPLVNDGKRTVSAKDAVTPEQPIVATEANQWSVWTQALGTFGKSYSVTDVPSYRYDSGGILVGADYRWSDLFSTGLFAGYQGTESRYPNEGRARSNGVNFGLYGSWGGESGFHASAVGTLGQSHYRVSREIRFGTIDRTAHSDFDAWTGSAFLESGYAFRLGAFRAGPIASVQYTKMDGDNFTERNAKSLNLRVENFDNESLQTNFGARIALPVAVSGDVVLVPEFRAVWNHEFMQDSATYQTRLDGGRGRSFNYEQTAPSRDSLTLGTGLSAQFGQRWNASLYYQANCASSQSVTHSVSLAAGLNF